MLLIIYLILSFCWPFGGALLTVVRHHQPHISVRLCNSMPAKSKVETIRNFRNIPGFDGIYRCANTDGLADRLDTRDDWSHAERTLLYDAGLIIDLRSDAERDFEKIAQWVSQAPGGRLHVVRDQLSFTKEEQRERIILHLDPLSSDDFMGYLDRNFMNTAQQLQGAMYKMLNGNKLQALRMDVLNQQGLAGLNEAILEIAKPVFFQALKAITCYLERHPRDTVVIHCVQGKDRTGILAMLCQSLIGLPDTAIVDDYNKSESMLGESAALRAFKPLQGKLNKTFFSGAPREAIEKTLAYLRTKYGSVNPGYFDAIGFDTEWRSRFITAVNNGKNSLSKL